MRIRLALDHRHMRVGLHDPVAAKALGFVERLISVLEGNFDGTFTGIGRTSGQGTASAARWDR